MKEHTVTYPTFQQPNTAEEAFATARELTGQFWESFSPVRVRKGAGMGLGGQAFLAKRIKGHEWSITQPLCYLCGQGVLTPRELIIALGRQVVETDSGRFDVKMSGGDVRPSPSPALVEKINLYGAEFFPFLTKYRKEKGEKHYDRGLPPASGTHFYIYVIQDELGDVKIGVTRQPKLRFRSIELHDKTNITRFECAGPSSMAFDIEGRLLAMFNAGRHPRKNGREWLWQKSFEEVVSALRNLTK